MVRRMHGYGFSRRRFMAGSALAGTSAFLAACTGGSGASAAPPSPAAPPAAPPASSAPGASPSTGAAPAPSYATEGALYMYNWAEYIDLGNIEEFKKRYNITDWSYDVYDSNEVL